MWWEVNITKWPQPAQNVKLGGLESLAHTHLPPPCALTLQVQAMTIQLDE